MARARSAEAKTQAAKVVVSKPGSWLWLQGLACGALVALAAPVAVLAALLLAPAFAAMALDTAPGKPVARSILLAGVAVGIHPIMQLWAAGHRMDTALDMAGNLTTLAPAWAAQSAVWLLCEIVPLLLALALEAAAQTRAARLRGARSRLEAEWGLPPADRSNDQ